MFERHGFAAGRDFVRIAEFDGFDERVPEGFALRNSIRCKESDLLHAPVSKISKRRPGLFQSLSEFIRFHEGAGGEAADAQHSFMTNFQRTAIKRKVRMKSLNVVFKVFGFLWVGLAVLGAVLPLLPTTPFLLLAAGCFARSSPELHRRLLANPTFGPMIRDWQENRTIPKRAKILALTSLVVFGGSSVLFVINNVFVQSFGIAVIGYGFVFVARIKTAPAKR